jgi:hypothetical protein
MFTAGLSAIDRLPRSSYIKPSKTASVLYNRIDAWPQEEIMKPGEFCGRNLSTPQNTEIVGKKALSIAASPNTQSLTKTRSSAISNFLLTSSMSNV